MRFNVKGSLVALITPMQKDGAIDYESLENLVNFHVESGTNAIVSVGTTGEPTTLSTKEHLSVLASTIKYAAGRIPIIAGTGSNSTSEAIDLAKEASSLGASGCLQVVPYYNKPTQTGLYKHFDLISSSVDLPIVIYNVPSRTVVDISNDVIIDLAQSKNIVGIKDATGKLNKGMQLISKAPHDFMIYSGDDATAILLMLMGGHGNISVTANIFPREMSRLCNLAMNGNLSEAKKIHMALLDVHNYLFLESNPIPVKWALAFLGLAHEGIRLPLHELSFEYRTILGNAILRAKQNLTV
ncbi:4-hydroxy-tetrahydrodipicolinate synthase [Aquitalea sp. LB_tupeE]|uniref:4-hydroxy-tetrahydrodipicolinate synthase n=1 Tax=Aquitalea sp. LB_tupeE TaxID=2748078 RepID=UPI0015B8CC15|nr:4-hydroxy-tetrahydrodipicolinate synthase [Aquitalea sp. LB_tupeE]NWK78793.1 4-hydroxy-tetrahydrodipicolinate synthase [Aquitalea sp. LB_tupeE]